MTLTERFQYAKDAKPVGITPAIALVNPLYPHNVGTVVRTASCYGIKQVWYTGDRIDEEVEAKGRLPREERMKAYDSVELRQFDRFFDAFPPDTIPIAIEVRKNSEQLPQFDHPENPLYVFGPEDGSIPSVLLQHCHRFVIIPTRHCLNLAQAVNVVMYDRFVKRQAAGLEPLLPTAELLDENRGLMI